MSSFHLNEDKHLGFCSFLNGGHSAKMNESDILYSVDVQDVAIWFQDCNSRILQMTLIEIIVLWVSSEFSISQIQLHFIFLQFLPLVKSSFLKPSTLLSIVPF